MAFPGALMGIMVFGMFLALLAAVFWLWMLVDCLQRPDKKFPAKGKNDKLIWVIVIVLTFIVGAILYYFLVKSRQ